jgi:hypothetical protein
MVGYGVGCVRFGFRDVVQENAIDKVWVITGLSMQAINVSGVRTNEKFGTTIISGK